MFKSTKGDLAKKSDAQLAALFQQATLGLSAAKSKLASAQSQLAIIRAELASRIPKLERQCFPATSRGSTSS